MTNIIMVLVLVGMVISLSQPVSAADCLAYKLSRTASDSNAGQDKFLDADPATFHNLIHKPTEAAKKKYHDGALAKYGIVCNQATACSKSNGEILERAKAKPKEFAEGAEATLTKSIADDKNRVANCATLKEHFITKREAVKTHSGVDMSPETVKEIVKKWNGVIANFDGASNVVSGTIKKVGATGP